MFNVAMEVIGRGYLCLLCGEFYDFDTPNHECEDAEE